MKRVWTAPTISTITATTITSSTKSISFALLHIYIYIYMQTKMSTSLQMRNAANATSEHSCVCVCIKSATQRHQNHNARKHCKSLGVSFLANVVALTKNVWINGWTLGLRLGQTYTWIRNIQANASLKIINDLCYIIFFKSFAFFPIEIGVSVVVVALKWEPFCCQTFVLVCAIFAPSELNILPAFKPITFFSLLLLLLHNFYFVCLDVPWRTHFSPLGAFNECFVCYACFSRKISLWISSALMQAHLTHNNKYRIKTYWNR